MTALAYLICALIWGTTWYAVRLSTIDGGFPPVQSAALRFALAAMILGAVVALGWGRTSRGTLAGRWRWLILAGVCNGVGYSLIYVGEQRVSGGIASVIFGLSPLTTGLLAYVFGLERIPARTLGGVAVSLVGTLILFADRLSVSADQAVGVVLLIAAVMASSGSTVVIKRHAADIHPGSSTAIFLLVSAAMLSLLAVGFEGEEIPWPPPAVATAAMLYLAIFGSIIAFVTYFYMLRRVILMTASSMVFVLPIIALAVDAVFERHITLGPRAYLGVAITLAGVGVSVLRPGRSVPAAPAPQLSSSAEPGRGASSADEVIRK